MHAKTRSGGKRNGHTSTGSLASATCGTGSEQASSGFTRHSRMLRRVRTGGHHPILALATAFALAIGGSLALVSSASAARVDRDGDGLTDAFEIHWGASDPNVADTNGDGLSDSAEDPDGDGLSNLGEQRFHTNPLRADSNRNGIPDNMEDSDHDGVPDGLEQDRRPVPANLSPSLANASHDNAPSYYDGCHVRNDRHIFRHCIYGDASSTHTVALFGDSHAAQWLPGLIRAARHLGWRVLNLTRSACPSADVTVWSTAQNGLATWCNDYRARAISFLRKHPPDVVILTNLGGTKLYRQNGSQVPADRVERVWALGLGSTLDQLPAHSRAIVLADTPYPGIDVPACLRAHRTSIAACERSRATNTKPAHAADEAQTAALHGAAFANLLAQTCPYDPCPVVVNSTLMWSDSSHLTATFSGLLAPSLRRVIKAAVGG